MFHAIRAATQAAAVFAVWSGIAWLIKEIEDDELLPLKYVATRTPEGGRMIVWHRLLSGRLVGARALHWSRVGGCDRYWFGRGGRRGVLLRTA